MAVSLIGPATELNRVTPAELRATTVSVPEGEVCVETVTLQVVGPTSLHVPGTDCNENGAEAVDFARM